MRYNETLQGYEKSVSISFVRDTENSGFIHRVEIDNPLKCGSIDFPFVLWSTRKAIKSLIGFLDFSKEIEFIVCDNIVGIAIFEGKVYTNKDGKIRFTLK